MTLTTEQTDWGLRIRRARKDWVCEGHMGYDPDAKRVRRCGRPIGSGTTYLEYLGESAAFQSGYRYCPDCAMREWQVTV